MSETDLIGREQRLLGFIALGVVVIGSSLGNVLLKLGARTSGAPLFGLANWLTIAGVLSFGCGVLAYAWALKQFDLHAAQIVISLQYVSVILLSYFFLSERIAVNEWIGIALIVVGIFVCMR
jgi:drug/metabolite transporter (DMT)-like permease